MNIYEQVPNSVKAEWKPGSPGDPTVLPTFHFSVTPSQLLVLLKGKSGAPDSSLWLVQVLLTGSFRISTMLALKHYPVLSDSSLYTEQTQL